MIRLDPKFAAAYNNRSLAWCDKGQFDKAISDSTKACELTDWKDYRYLDTLATAYAGNGDFNEAQKWQVKAIDLAPPDEKADYRSRLELFRQKPKK